MKFYFNVCSDSANEEDREGIDLPSLADARKEAVRAAKEMVVDMLAHDDRIDGMRFEIVDESGQLLETVRFRDLLGVD